MFNRSRPDDGGNGVEAEVKLEWVGAESLAELLETLGETPIPPYFNRPATPADTERYQTVYVHARTIAPCTNCMHRVLRWAAGLSAWAAGDERACERGSA